MSFILYVIGCFGLLAGVGYGALISLKLGSQRAR
jgi:hypothetical protein